MSTAAAAKTTGRAFLRQSNVSITYTCHIRGSLTVSDIPDIARLLLSQPTHVFSRLSDWLVGKRKGGACFRNTHHWASLGPMGVLVTPILSHLFRQMSS